MEKINTRTRIVQAALELFAELGFQKSSIARIEKAAGLAPRAGAFYRHFESKEALLLEIARTYLSETPEAFGFDRLAGYGDTRAELVAIALKYEEAMIRQKPYARLIEEIRLLDFGIEMEHELNADMMAGLEAWVKSKRGAKGLTRKKRLALVFNVFGAWLYYLDMAQKESAVDGLRDMLLDDWATHWAAVLDGRPVPGMS